jgi:hypothetical protein
MLSTHPVNHFSQVLAVVVMGLACVSVAGKGHAAKADMDEATVMSNYRAAMALSNIFSTSRKRPGAKMPRRRPS